MLTPIMVCSVIALAHAQPRRAPSCSIPRYYESLGHLHVGTQPNRAYYVPASTPMDTVGENRVNSDRFMLLNGDWDFKYYASIYDLDAEVSRLRAAGRPVF